ncbi:hypothetical protein B0A55_13761, partial [Friedmanniomyces simplex]
EKAAERPGLQRSTSQLFASSSSSLVAAEPVVLDSTLHDTAGATASVVELSDDVLTPPAEASMNMLGGAA